MSFEIGDVSSMIVQRSLANSTKNLEASMVKLSYGKQMSAAENAANLIISENMEMERRGSMQAIQNAQDGMNMLATAEGGLSSTTENLQRVRELAIQRENGTYSENDKAAIDSEINALMEEIDRNSASTSFNGTQLLDGSADVTLQIGANSDEATNSLDVNGVLKATSSSDLELDPSTDDFLDKIDSAISDVTGRRSELGAMQNRLESTIESLFVQNENITASQSRIIDVDVAAESSKLTQNQILQNASASLLAQANQSASIASTLL